MIDFSEWSRTQAQINYAALEMMNSAKIKTSQPNDKQMPMVDNSEKPANQVDKPKKESNRDSLSPADNRKVFISYSHLDSFAMKAVKEYLAKKKIKATIDLNDLSAGESIQGFIDQALKNNDFVISIISQNSLRSGWVSKELVVAKYLNKTNSNWIPVSIDNAWSNNKFFFEANTEIDKKIAEARTQISDAIKGNLDISPFIDEEKRLQELKANLGTTISDLKKVLVIDISGQLFEIGMKKVIDKIKTA